MNSKIWKISVVIVSLGILFSFNLLNGFSSYQETYSCISNNVYEVIVVSLPGYNVNGEIIIFMNTISPNITNTKIIFPNGTEISGFNAEYTITYHFNGKLALDETFYSNISYWVNGSRVQGPEINLSPENPFEAFVINVNSSYNNQGESIINYLSSYGLNVYYIFVQNSSWIIVDMVGDTV